LKIIAAGATLLLATLTLAQTPTAPPPAGSAYATSIPAAMQPFVDQGQIAGIVTLVATKDKLLHLAAVGTSDLSRKMQPDDLFWIASMSKPMTAVAAALLVDEGKLAFDDPVDKYLPEFKDLRVGPPGGALPPARPVTLRDLLTHTSGLPEYATTQPHWTLEQFTRQIASQPLRFQPGSRWQYSTAGIDAVGRVVEVVSGVPFGEFMDKRVFNPLGMKDTSFWVRPDQKARYAHTYRLNAQTNKLEEAVIPYMYGTAVDDRQRAPLGGAGIFSTAEDVAHFYQMALNNGAFNNKPFLKPDTLAQMTKNQIGTLTARPGMPWGYGFSVITDPAAFEANKPLSPGTFGHGGAFGTSSWADPAKGLIYVQMLERDKMGNPDNSPMHIAFNQAATQAAGAKP
jgi:CubicO group peptidase (beta-lactamase class C family)